jgi:phosphatidate cytidylyltransferase
MTEAATAKQPRKFTREITALIGAPMLLAVIILGPPWSYITLIAATSSLALWEFLTLGEKKGYPVQKLLSIALMLFLFAAFVFEQLSVEVAVFAILLLIPAVYVFSRRSIEAALPGTAVCVLGTLYIGMLNGALLRLRLDFVVGWKLVVFLLISVWAGDAGAYYVGRAFGKTRLSPRVSPKKTVEGGVGGVFASMVAAAIIAMTFFREFPLVHAVTAAAVLSVSGVVGDLAESLWKRSADVKDSGTLIPGHGGFLDRLDSIYFTAPLLYGYWWLLENDWRL